MPAKPRWLLAIPDAISQLEALDRPLLIRRDIEQLFGVRKHRSRAAFRHEEERRERLVTELRKARLTGIRVKLPAETLDTKLASLPPGVSVTRVRIEVRFNGAKEAVERLYGSSSTAGERW